MTRAQAPGTALPFGVPLGIIGCWLLLSRTIVAAPAPQDDRDAEDGSGKKRAPLPSLVALPDDYVRFARVPEDGRYPRIQPDRHGRITVLFYRGGEKDGDLWLTRTQDEARSFSPAVRVNAQPGSVPAAGAPMASLALTPDGKACVAWVSADAPPALRFAREKDGAFEELDLGAPAGLGVSAAVAVDAEGQVYLFHAALEPAISPEHEPEQRVWMRRSTDGSSFSDPISIEKEKFSASEQSAIAAHVDAVEGTLFVLYRASAEGEKGNFRGRDMRLIASEDRGESFKSGPVDNWKVKRDPHSSSQLFQDVSTTLAAFEARGQVFWAPIKRANNRIQLPVEPRDDERQFWRTAAFVAANRKNEVLLSWLERPAKEVEATPVVRWQVWQKDARAPLGNGQAPEPPGSSSPAAFARADGGFVVLY